MGCLVLVLAASLVTCRLDDLITPSTAAVRLTLATDTVGIADTARLVAIVTVDGKQSQALRVEWSTDAPGFATVDTLGLVRGVARGTATVTARVANTLFLRAPITASAAVRVVVPRLDLVADHSVLTSVGDTVCVTPTARDALGADLGLSPDSLRPDSVFTQGASARCFVASRSSGPVAIRAWIDLVQDTALVTVAPLVVLVAETAVFADSAVQGSATPRVTTRLVRNTGSGTLGARARRTLNSSWLSVTPDTLTLLADESKSLQLEANPSGLGEGFYPDTVVIESAGAAGSPKRIPVAFRIQCPSALIAPDALVAGSFATDDCLARNRPSGNADFYRFAGNAGDTVTATLSVGSGSGADPYLFLLNAAGTAVASNDDCPPPPATRNSCITGFVLPVTGVYTLEATTFSPATGPYTLTLSRPAAPGAPTNLAQLKPNGTGIPSGGTTEFTAARFRAVATDPNANDSLRLEVELRDNATTFANTATHTGGVAANATGGVTLTASVPGLVGGTAYHWQVRACDQSGRCGPWTASGGNPDFTVTVTGPILTVTPDPIRDSALAGSTTPVTRSLTIENTGSGSVNWTATNKTTWLSLAPGSGTAPTTVNLTLNPTGLPAGVHEDTVIVTDGGTALGSPDTTIVTFVIEQPVLAVSPAQIIHSVNANSGVTFNDTLGISNSGTGGLAWTAIVDSTWVGLGKINGSAPDKLPLTIVPGGRPAGTYTAHVVVSAAGATGSPDTTLVTLTVNQPVLAVAPAAVTDSANYGSTAPRDVTLQITNAAGGTLTWNAAEPADSAWLSILGPSSGSAPGTLTLRLDPRPGGQLLMPGTHADTVVLMSPEAINDPIRVPVQFLVPRPILSVTPDSVFDTVTVGGTTPRTIAVTISNGNGGVLAWTAGDSVPFSTWLSLSPSSGAGPGALMVTLNPISLSAGVHRDTVVIRSDSATGSPRRLPVRFDVLRPPDPPTSLGQFRTAGGGGTEITPGGVTTETSVVFKAFVTDGDPGDALRIELQVEKVGTGFGATAAVSPPVASGQTATVTFGAPFEDNSGYHWRVRTCDQTNRCSGWVSFGGVDESVVDFFANPVPQTPAVPTDTGQFASNGTTPIAEGGTAGSASATVVLKGLVTDPDPGDLISLQVEVKETTTAGPDGTGLTPPGTGVATNGYASVTLTRPGAFLTGTNYYWRARACDQTGLCSDWVNFGNNLNVSGGLLSPAGTDFRVNP